MHKTCSDVQLYFLNFSSNAKQILTSQDCFYAGVEHVSTVANCLCKFVRSKFVSHSHSQDVFEPCFLHLAQSAATRL